MICEHCGQVITLEELKTVIKGPDDKWYHPDCLIKANDKIEHKV